MNSLTASRTYWFLLTSLFLFSCSDTPELLANNDPSRYQGDPSKVIVTGDSAGAHLAASVVNMGQRLNSNGFTGEQLGFNPSYLPEGVTAEAIAEAGGVEVQAAILSYGTYDVVKRAVEGFEKVTNPFWIMGGAIARGLLGDAFNAAEHPERYKAVSPHHNLPESAERQLPPQLLTAGSLDTLVTPASVKEYRNKLESAGHAAQYWEHEGRPHAFLDSGSNAVLGISFEADAPPALDVMIRFLDELFYP